MKELLHQSKKYLLEDKNRAKIRYILYSIFFVLLVLTITTDVNVREDKEYDDYSHIVLYIDAYGETPPNYVHKSESNTIEGDELFLYATFNNNEGLLPSNQTYTEVYINAVKGDVGAERIVYSSTNIYYTDDHYQSFSEVETEDIKGIHDTFLLFLIITIFIDSGIIIYFIVDKDFSYRIIIKDLKNDYKNGLNYIKNINQKENPDIT